MNKTQTRTLARVMDTIRMCWPRIEREGLTLLPETALHDGLGMDALDVAELLMEIEAACNVRIDDDRLDALLSVADVVREVEAQRRRRRKP